jgi:hypothetical protein
VSNSQLFCIFGPIAICAYHLLLTVNVWVIHISYLGEEREAQRYFILGVPTNINLSPNFHP